MSTALQRLILLDLINSFKVEQSVLERYNRNGVLTLLACTYEDNKSLIVLLALLLALETEILSIKWFFFFAYFKGSVSSFLIFSSSRDNVLHSKNKSHVKLPTCRMSSVRVALYEKLFGSMTLNVNKITKKIWFFSTFLQLVKFETFLPDSDPEVYEVDFKLHFQRQN